MSDYVTPQPPPKNEDGQSVWALVIKDIDDKVARTGANQDRTTWWQLGLDARQRNADGIRKHGVPLTVSNGRDAAVDGYQEALDATVYWRQEYERTQDQHAQALYDASLHLALASRRYLHERDGK